MSEPIGRRTAAKGSIVHLGRVTGDVALCGALVRPVGLVFGAASCKRCIAAKAKADASEKET